MSTTNVANVATLVGVQLLTATACGGFSNGKDDEYVVLSVSGHCFTDCDYWNVNQEYLEAEGAASAVAEALPDGDGDVGVIPYGDAYYTMEDSESGEIIVVGFLDLVDDMRDMRDSSTEVVVLCHSHGCVWAHTALQVVPDLDIAALIDLDAESLGWESDTFTGGVGDDWASIIEDDGRSWPFNIAWAADAWEVQGVSGLQDVEDVVPDSVAINLEVASDDWTSIQDAEPNHYADGASDRVLFFQSSEAHEDVDRQGSDAIRWVTETLPGVL